MSTVAILGAGPIGAAIAHALAERQAVRAIRLLDAEASVAAGKALDLLQTMPIDGVDVSLSGSADLLSATGAAVIVIADRVSGGEWQGEEGLALVRQLVRAGTAAPLVFAGGSQIRLMEAVTRRAARAGRSAHRYGAVGPRQRRQSARRRGNRADGRGRDGRRPAAGVRRRLVVGDGRGLACSPSACRRTACWRCRSR